MGDDRTNAQLIAEARRRATLPIGPENRSAFYALADRLEAETKPVLVCSDCGQPSGRDRGHVDDAAFKRCLDRERLARERDEARAELRSVSASLAGSGEDVARLRRSYDTARAERDAERARADRAEAITEDVAGRAEGALGGVFEAAVDAERRRRALEVERDAAIASAAAMREALEGIVSSEKNCDCRCRRWCADIARAALRDEAGAELLARLAKAEAAALDAEAWCQEKVCAAVVRAETEELTRDRVVRELLQSRAQLARDAPIAAAAIASVAAMRGALEYALANCHVHDEPRYRAALRDEAGAELLARLAMAERIANKASERCALDAATIEQLARAANERDAALASAAAMREALECIYENTREDEARSTAGSALRDTEVKP